MLLSNGTYYKSALSIVGKKFFKKNENIFDLTSS